MLIKNLSKKTIITKDAKECKSFLDKAFGLINSKNPRSLIMYTRFGIHTFGLIQLIDVLILDGQKRVVKLKKSLTPNSFFFWNPKYSLVLELPQGTIENTKTHIGDKVNIKFS